MAAASAVLVTLSFSLLSKASINHTHLTKLHKVLETQPTLLLQLPDCLVLHLLIKQRNKEKDHGHQFDEVAIEKEFHCSKMPQSLTKQYVPLSELLC